MATKQITYGDLKDGMKIWIQGYLFEVKNLRSEGQENAAIRFEGRVVDVSADIHRTGYDGGTYGSYAWVACTVEDEEREAAEIPAEIEELEERIEGMKADDPDLVFYSNKLGELKAKIGKVSA